MTSKTILVTGGAGFIGSHLVDRLVQLGHRVLIVDDLSTGKIRNLPRGVNFYHTDVNHASIDNIFQKESPNVVFHNAAQISVTSSVRDPGKDAEINVAGTARLIEASRRYGVDKFVYSCTGGALYGDPDPSQCTEESPIVPLSPYGLSKWVGERYLDLYRRTYRLNSVSLRYGNVYGPRQDPHGEAGVVAIFANAMLEGQEPRIYGDGNQERDFVYIEDVVQANILALEEGVSGAYNIGTAVGTSINDIAKILGEIFKYRRKPSHSPARIGDVRRISLDYSKAKREMGWEPTIFIREGLLRTAEYFKELAKAPA